MSLSWEGSKAKSWLTTHKQCSIGISVVQRRKTVETLLPCCVPEGHFHLEHKPQGWSIKAHSSVARMLHTRACGRGCEMSTGAPHLLPVDLESLGREGRLHGGLLALVKGVVDDARHQRCFSYSSWSDKAA